ncbi:MAG TPA: carbamoyl-phosphate synthase large subunit, partial [Candidatus Edwardsbacteria bacterium]|nr:carbamoyl-phosphate synthase large subunit [Candidatus Edwardsbacteria bacterium]
CNIQYALDPASDRYRVIEVNARLSRSSALASKATGYPLAYVATKLALGHGLHQLRNAVTGTTTACCEPALDYVVCKLPRWDMDKFAGISREIGSSMKSVGEVMAIGRSFEEAIQKGLRMIGQGMHGFVANRGLRFDDLDAALAHPTDLRIFAVSEALDRGYSVARLHQLTGIDPWFLAKLARIVVLKDRIAACDGLESLPTGLLRTAKQAGFSDFQLARLVLKGDPGQMEQDALTVREHRIRSGVLPAVKQIDTLAAEYPARTNYLYLTYGGTEHDVAFEGDGRSVIVLGSGAYRIGSSVEFDWCGVNAADSVKTCGYRSVMINYNPETVSTDYDRCDRLYFEELSLERVLDIADLERPHGVIVAVGGQIPNNLALRLHRRGVPVLGTSPLDIDRAEDRHAFSAMLDRLRIDQPRWRELAGLDEIRGFAGQVGFPLLVRPSYVLSGAAMNVVSNDGELERFLTLAARVSQQHPVVVSEFIQGAKEIEVDAVARDGEVLAYAICEHVEFAGVHSGDATMVFPPQKIYVETVRRVKRIARAVARELRITGPFNMQFLAKDNGIRVIECNLRCSRSFPFVSKVLRANLVDLAVRAMLGREVRPVDKSLFELDYIGVKAPQFSFSRLHQADPVLGVEMASTGEVACLGDTFYEAILTAMLAVGYAIPRRAILLSTGPTESKTALLGSVRLLAAKGFELYATRGTALFLRQHGIAAEILHWPDEPLQPNTLDYLRRRRIDLVINIPKDLSRHELANDHL